MTGRSQVPLAVMLVLLVGSACAQSTAPPSSVQAPEAPPRRTITLTTAITREPTVILSSMASGIPHTLRNAMHQRLASTNERGQPFPQLATALPSRDAGTWIVRPDGTMRTTYRIHPGVTWHDGAPLTASDFAFAWQVTTDRDLPILSRVAAVRACAVPSSSSRPATWLSTARAAAP